jgi:hypothetical protein
MATSLVCFILERKYFFGTKWSRLVQPLKNWTGKRMLKEHSTIPKHVRFEMPFDFRSIPL